MDLNEVLAKIWEAYEAGELVTACAWCGRVRIEGEWYDPPQWALSTIDDLTLSHLICPRCAAQLTRNSGEALTRRAEQPAPH
jgi:hypothetical protein